MYRWPKVGLEEGLVGNTLPWAITNSVSLWANLQHEQMQVITVSCGGKCKTRQIPNSVARKEAALATFAIAPSRALATAFLIDVLGDLLHRFDKPLSLPRQWQWTNECYLLSLLALIPTTTPEMPVERARIVSWLASAPGPSWSCPSRGRAP